MGWGRDDGAVPVAPVPELGPDPVQSGVKIVLEIVLELELECVREGIG